MGKDDLFDFKLNKAKDYWSVTGYYGRQKEIIFPASYEGKPVKTIGDGFSPNNKRIKRLTIPEGYTCIGEEAFSGCTGLTDIKLPESLAFIGYSAFSGCTGLTEIKFPQGLASIGGRAFYGCAGLTKIKLPESLTSVEDCTFEYCSRLTDITFPKRLTSIGENAFQYCSGLKKIKFSESLTSIGEWTFRNCTGLEEIYADENNPVFRSLDGIMFDKAMTTMMWFPARKKGKYSVPDGIIRIRCHAFDDCREITSITFPQSLLFIESYGFNCEQLTDITVNESNPDYYSIDGVLFDKERDSLYKYPKNKGKTDYAVPDGTKYI